MNAPMSADFGLLVSRNAVRERLRDALRLYVGRGRRYSVKELSNGTGVPDRLIESAMCEVDNPDFRPLSHEALASIAKFLGAPFVSHYLELSGLGAFELMDGQIPLPKVLASADTPEDASEERKRLIRQHPPGDRSMILGFPWWPRPNPSKAARDLAREGARQRRERQQRTLDETTRKLRKELGMSEEWRAAR